jgi:prepilin-type processing-associated H-X9-DG protein
VAPYSADPAGITGGLLYQYNSSLGIYKCPGDQSPLELPDGTKLTQPRIRSYNMSQSVNGISYAGQIAAEVPHYTKVSEPRSPGPANLFVFMEVHQDEIVDDQFGIPVESEWWWAGEVWWDLPANRHNQGCDFSFADGHVEHWRWKVPKAMSMPRGYVQPVAAGEMDDYDRMERGFRQDMGP